MKPIVEPLNDPRIRAVEAASNLRPAYSPFEYFEKWPKLVTPVYYVVGVCSSSDGHEPRMRLRFPTRFPDNVDPRGVKGR